ncbi:L,D-transpeptidase [Brevirhabdus pacifica]|uniref:L,D-transpeptidase n=1 Tax=Brevirhabdus pacifica TaxID=1267768 RepID=A0A1U7DK32_9RHOB|nr:L,D-transpeptidase family protein [Brevirhabdus pacifica]APX90239.1 L,D-transpeptidase [Brevirhabdus pacifica]OWU78712.1 hypothetical protein ATO5_08165 [Loktanella sp. 22II-4b]PJJ80676.1 L,D-transpeptidase-like protein [Brevirhabdus pacifica]
MTGKSFSRRGFVLSGSVGLATLSAPAILRAQTATNDPALAEDLAAEQRETASRNLSSFRMLDWREHFPNTKNGVLLCDTVSRVAHFWSEDESIYKIYPTSVPISEELTKRGMTRVIRKVEGPTWTPTPSMRERDPSLPVTVPAGPKNPLGTHALYLSWQYYRVHGTHDTRKIGRRSSDGCIGLYNAQIAELFSLAKVGTQVKLV